MTSDPATFSNNVPMLLLPPSEGKSAGGSTRRTPWAPDAGRFGARFGDRRAEVAAALAQVGGGDERLLGVRGDHLLRAQSANTELIGSATLPAWQRYTGVVWSHLDPATLPPTAHRRLLVVSGLLGLVRGDDPAPDYRLKMGASLAPLGKLSTWWRDAITTEIGRLARRSTVVDLLPQEHRAALDRDALHDADVLVVSLVERSGAAGGHAAKAAKGEFARALLVDGLDALDTWQHERFLVTVES